VSKTRLGLAGGLAAAVALLTGCGSLSPGAAVTVGDETITVDEIDEYTSDYCQAVERQLEGDGQTVPNRYFRSGIAGQLALRSAAEQLAEEYDVEPGETYDQKVAQLEQAVAPLEEDLQDSVVLVETATAYVEAIQAAVGERLLADEGAARTEYSEQVTRGERALEDWISEHGVEFDPQLGVDLVKGQVAPVDTSVSVPFGESAQEGAKETPDQGYAAGLPSTQRCG
jgi:peptidyl-prolyl cis-trans isomerase SurA